MNEYDYPNTDDQINLFIHDTGYLIDLSKDRTLNIYTGDGGHGNSEFI